MGYQKPQTRWYTDEMMAVDLTAIKKSVGFKTTQIVTISRRDSSISVVFGNERKNFVAYRLDDEKYEIHFSIEKQPNTLGGFRYYLTCPKCKSRRKQLYLRWHTLGCRKCQGLHYRTETQSYIDRQYSAVDKLYSKVEKLDGYRCGSFSKRKWEHHKTYWQRWDKIQERNHRIIGIIDRKFGFSCGAELGFDLNHR